jgi:hypothetical protein
VKDSPQKPWKLFVIDEVSLIGEKENVVATFKSNGKFEVPPSLVPRRTSPPINPGLQPPPPSPVPSPSPPFGNGNPAVRSLPAEPFPLGSAQAQAESYTKFQLRNTEALGKTQSYSVFLVGAVSQNLDWNGKDIPGRRLQVLSSANGQLLFALSIFAPDDICQKLEDEMRKQPAKRLPCVVEFKPIRFVTERNRVPHTECLLISASMANAANPGTRISLEPNWTELGVDVDSIGAKPKVAPVGRQPEAAPPQQPNTPAAPGQRDAMRPVGVPAPVPGSDDGSNAGWAIPFVLVVGVGIAGTLFLVIKKSNEKPSRAGSHGKRNRYHDEDADEDDEDEDDPRPSRRSRRR